MAQPDVHSPTPQGAQTSPTKDTKPGQVSHPGRPQPGSGGPADTDISSGVDTGAIQPGDTQGATSQ